MASNISKLIVTRQPFIEANFTEANHLGKAMLTRPEKIFPIMTTIFSSKDYFSDNPLFSSLFNTKRFTYVDSREFEWDIMGNETRPLVVTEKVETSTQPGIGNSTFRIVLDENWYMPGDVLTPGTVNKKYQARIQAGPIKHGTGWVYVMQLVDPDPANYIPVSYLEPGTRWTKMFSVYGEMSDQAGSTQFAMPMSLRANIGRLKKQYAVSGDVASDDNRGKALAVTLVDQKGNKYTSWIKYVEAMYWKQWYREIERYIWYGRYGGGVLKDSNGRPVDTSPGIQQQLEDSNIHYYSKLSSKLLEEYLMDIYYSRIKPGSRKRIRVYTGEAGMLEFNRAMQELIAAGQWYLAGTNFNPMEKVKSQYHSNAYSVGYQFTIYKMANGAEVEVIHNPIYDDVEIHLERHPITGYPLESYRMTFLDFEGENFDNNVLLVRKRNAFKLGYYNGMTTPWGPVNKQQISHKGDWYEVIMQDEFGVVVKDVTRCGELILATN